MHLIFPGSRRAGGASGAGDEETFLPFAGQPGVGIVGAKGHCPLQDDRAVFGGGAAEEPHLAERPGTHGRIRSVSG